jgi:general bacterial porin, GBP family
MKFDTSCGAMLRPLLVCTAVVFAGQASAQGGSSAPSSSVTVYGVADACVVSYRSATGPRVQVNGGGCFYGSRVGFRGSEDLGGGLRAYFVLEGGLTLDNGLLAQGGRAFGRKSFAGLGGRLGALEFGRDYAPAFYLLSTMDPMQLGIGSATATVWSGSASTSSGRTDNAVAYLSPDVGGFSARVQLAPGEQSAPAASRGGDTKGVNVLYRQGSVVLGAAYAHVRNSAGTAADTATTLGAKVDFGAFSLTALAQSGAWEGTRSAAAPSSPTSMFSRRYHSVVLGGTLKLDLASVSASYKRYDDRTASDFDANVWSVVYIYPLSKRTQLYTGTSQLKNVRRSSYGAADGNGAYTGVAAGGRSRVIDAGITHFF